MQVKTKAIEIKDWKNVLEGNLQALLKFHDSEAGKNPPNIRIWQ